MQILTRIVGAHLFFYINCLWLSHKLPEDCAICIQGKEEKGVRGKGEEDIWTWMNTPDVFSLTKPPTHPQSPLLTLDDTNLFKGNKLSPACRQPHPVCRRTPLPAVRRAYNRPLPFSQTPPPPPSPHPHIFLSRNTQTSPPKRTLAEKLKRQQ